MTLPFHSETIAMEIRRRETECQIEYTERMYDI